MYVVAAAPPPTCTFTAGGVSVVALGRNRFASPTKCHSLDEHMIKGTRESAGVQRVEIRDRYQDQP
jgi:hypothetical protein